MWPAQEYALRSTDPKVWEAIRSQLSQGRIYVLWSTENGLESMGGEWVDCDSVLPFSPVEVFASPPPDVPEAILECAAVEERWRARRSGM